MTEKQKAIYEAIEAVEKGATISAAARQYGIPRSTLDDKIRGRYSVECSKGPATVLTKQEEIHLKNWIIFMADSGFPVTKAQLLDSVSLLVKKMKRANPFQNNRPGRHWFESFIKRHPEVGQRVAQNLTQTRALVQEKNLRAWFKEVEDYFFTAQLQEAAQDPRRIFNCDESAFFLSPTDNRVLAKRGSKNVYNVIPSSEKECVTVLITANAAGELAPPMVLFKLKSIPHKISKTAPNDWGLGFTPKGWMTGESFYEFIANVFFPWIVKSGIQLPIIFFLDGHCSHTTLPLSNFCREKNIQLVALYPNATHLIQPMDVAVFRPLKSIWKKNVYNWRNDNQFVKLKKENFCPLLHKSLNQLDPNSIRNGFRKCGLSPFDANNVDYSKCVTSHTKITVKPDNVSQMQSDNINHFNFFESQISPTNLTDFKRNKTSTWTGDKSLEGLFNVWKRMNPETHLKTSTHFSGLETYDINESPSIEDIGNFTGLTAILDTNQNPNNNTAQHNNDNIITEHYNHEAGNFSIELYENYDGTLKKVMDMEIPSTLENLVEDKKPPETPQVIRTVGSTPIYITSSRKMSSNTPVFDDIFLLEASKSQTTSTSLELNTTQPSFSAYIDATVELPQTQTSTQIHTITQSSFPSKQIPSDKTPPILSNKIKPTYIMVEDTTPNYALSKGTTSENITTVYEAQCEGHTPITQALSEDENHEQQKTKYYGELVVPTPFKDALFWPETPSSSTKSKVKLPSVITSDRWQIFAQNKIEAKKKKENTKVKAKAKKSNKPELGAGSKKPKKKLLDTGRMNIANEDWFCRLCQRSTVLDMVQCVTCKIWYHTICAEVSPSEITFSCMYCNVSFDE